MNLRKAAEQALECLDYHWDNPDSELEEWPYVLEAKQALRQALRQALAEPEDPRIVELRTLMAEPTVTGVIFEVHRGPLSKSIREYGDCPCPTQEPVGYAHVDDLKREHHDFYVNRERGVNEVPLYTAPPKKEWVWLTHDEVNSWYLPDSPTVFEFAQFIEAKLKEKNT